MEICYEKNEDFYPVTPDNFRCRPCRVLWQPWRRGKGGTAEVTVKKHTTGQELIDLQKAHENGAISDEEYEKQKEAILKREK